MIQFIITSIVVIFLLWASSFLVFWITITKFARMIATLEEAVDYIILKDKVKNLPEEEFTKIETKLEILKERIRKDFDI